MSSKEEPIAGDDMSRLRPGDLAVHSQWSVGELVNVFARAAYRFDSFDEGADFVLEFGMPYSW